MKGQLSVTSPDEYIAALEGKRRADVARLDELVRETAPELERYIQSGMLAYGTYPMKYANGKTADWCRIAIASNAQYISLYVSGSYDGISISEKYRNQLPKAKVGKCCIRFATLSQIDESVLREVIRSTAEWQPE